MQAQPLQTMQQTMVNM
jgi:hypothetical protein